jgi:hypothetical protein
MIKTKTPKAPKITRTKQLVVKTVVRAGGKKFP